VRHHGEAYYSATNVGPTTAFVQMPPNAEATALLGLGAGLQPEKATNYSVGFVVRGEKGFGLTFDVFQVEVRNRIAATSTFYGTINGQLYSQAIVDAIIANGNVLDPEVTAGDTGINLFTNGVTTETRGAERCLITGGFAADINWSISATTAGSGDRCVLRRRNSARSRCSTGRLADLKPGACVANWRGVDWDRVCSAA
jgi:iron complex outermembrane receptor protein